MEGGFPKKRNIRPVEKSNLPLVTLLVLVSLVLGMLYVGYEYISDSSSNSEELTSKVIDSTSLDVPEANEQVASPETAIDDNPPAPKAEDKKEENKKEEEPSKKPTVAAVSASSVGGEQITHEVKSGETFSSIASRYNLKTETLKGLNSSLSEVKAGSKLKVQVQAVHTVGPGDVLRVVSEKYGVTKEALMKANAKTRDFSERGEKLIIPFASKK